MIVGWSRFADGEIHELSTDEIRGYGSTRALAMSSVRRYARYRGLQCSAISLPDGGIKFRIWGEQGAEDLSHFLPADVVARDRERDRLQQVYFPQPSAQVSHRDCTHPKTQYERRKCRDQRRKAG